MPKPVRVVVLVFSVGVLLAALIVWRRPPDASVLAAPNIFSGPVNGGCYLATTTTCRIHVDSWQPITTDPGTSLIGFQLAAIVRDAGLVPLYDFRTDVSSPPQASYLPSLVKQDFAAQCGATYHLALRAKDSSDAEFVEIGRTNVFTCPVVLETLTPTPTQTVTPTGTPAGTPQPPHEAIYAPVILGSPRQ